MTAHICTDIQTMTILVANPPPCFQLFLHFAPFYMTWPLFLLTWRTSFFCSWCENPSTLSLLAINCSPLAASSTPRHPADQVTYLHRRLQQSQLFRLTQSVPAPYFITNPLTMSVPALHFLTTFDNVGSSLSLFNRSFDYVNSSPSFFNWSSDNVDSMVSPLRAFL
jgi:hypothetical protein